MSVQWWNRLPTRLLDEDAALRALVAADPQIVRSYRWCRDENGEPRIEVQLAIGEKGIHLEVRFPAHYPNGCPSVRPIPHTRIFSSHQFRTTGVFCLELGPDNWHARHTAAEMVRSTWRLILGEIIALDEELEIPSRHVTDLGDRLAAAGGALLRTEAFDAAVGGPIEPTEFEAVWPIRASVRVVPVAVPKGQALDDLSRVFRYESRCRAMIIPLDAEAALSVPEPVEEFNAYVQRHGGVELGSDVYIVVLRWSNGVSRGFLRIKATMGLVDIPFRTDEVRTPSSVRAASTARIGIVGLGSLGSKIAVSLARTGISRFVLIDGGVLHAHNICRHAASYLEVGAFKVDVVRELIRDVSGTNPDVERHPLNLLTATHPDVHAGTLESLGGCDIIIDATADHDVFGLLAGVASDKRRPLVWGEVFGGGLGGLVASAQPDASPCPSCVRDGFINATAAWPPAPGQQARDPYGADDVSPLVASDADVSVIASAMAIRALSVLAGTASSSVTLLGFRRDWIFEHPFDSRHVHVRSDDYSCARCWTPDSEADPDAAAEAERLFSSADADATRSA
jgi:molybdopterin/thiamine biosynthesis adenylyltransferase